MQGFNMGRYVPPDQEGLMSGNALHSKKPLGNRSSKSSQGILTVRFEMPFPIWCTTCPKPTIIGQGVRFNAEKKKIGNYYTTPIYSFRMKHTACGGWIEIRTDPKNTAYVVHEGARKRDTGEDKFEEGDIKILTEEEREERRNNAFASLEGKVEDKARLEAAKERIDEIQILQDQQWEDPYLLNQKLRKSFRTGRKEREQQAQLAGQLQDRMSLGIELLPESEEDSRRAAFVEFGVPDPEIAISRAVSRPLFTATDKTSTIRDRKIHSAASSKIKSSSSKLKTVQLAEKRKADFAAEIRDNTRAKMDPFLQPRRDTATSMSWKAVGIKRRRDVTEADKAKEIESVTVPQQVTPALVNYDSD